MKTNLALLGTGLIVAACAYHLIEHTDRGHRAVQRTVQRVRMVTAPVIEKVKEKTWAFPFHVKRRKS